MYPLGCMNSCLGAWTLRSIAASRRHFVSITIILMWLIGSFHEPKTLLHKVEKTLMLETDSSETANEMIKSVRKMGRCGVIAAYSGYTNHFNIGALMEKGVRFIGNGQGAFWPEFRVWYRLMNICSSCPFVLAGNLERLYCPWKV